MNAREIEQMRQAAIDMLADAGVWLSRSASVDAICLQIAKLTGNEKRPRQRKMDYIGCWMDKNKPTVAAPYRPEFRPLRLVRHPRADDIQRAQPPLWTPKGIGNVKQLGGFMPQVWGV